MCEAEGRREIDSGGWSGYNSECSIYRFALWVPSPAVPKYIYYIEVCGIPRVGKNRKKGYCNIKLNNLAMVLIF